MPRENAPIFHPLHQLLLSFFRLLPALLGPLLGQRLNRGV
jgi:hypothetical protein